MPEEIVDFELILTPTVGKVFAAAPGFIAGRMLEVSFLPDDTLAMETRNPEIRSRYIVDTSDQDAVRYHFPGGANMRDRNGQLHAITSVVEVPISVRVSDPVDEG